MSEEAKIESVPIRSNEDHSLPEAHARTFGNLRSNPKVCPFSTVEKVTRTRFRSASSLPVGFFGNVRRLIGTKNAGDDILSANNERPGLGQLRRGVWAVEDIVAKFVKSRPRPTNWRWSVRRHMERLQFCRRASCHSRSVRELLRSARQAANFPTAAHVIAKSVAPSCRRMVHCRLRVLLYRRSVRE